MTPDLSDRADHFAPALRSLETALGGLRAGRASAGLVENVLVEAHGARLRLKEVATIAVSDPRTIVVQVWDRELLRTVEQALAASPIGINPVLAGTVIRLALPPLTVERRNELVRLVRRHVEDARIRIRQIREGLLKDLRRQKEEGALSEDDFARARDDLQRAVESATAAAAARGGVKESDILGRAE